MTDYKATTQQWAEVEEWVEGSECSWDHCLVELRDRVDTLEHALQQTRVDYLRLSNAVANSCPDRNKFFADLMSDGNSSDTNVSNHIGQANKKVIDLANYPESPDGSLVERVAATLHAVTNSDPNVPANEWEPEARAVIFVVAAWLQEEGYPNSSGRLEKEAKK